MCVSLPCSSRDLAFGEKHYSHGKSRDFLFQLQPCGLGVRRMCCSRGQWCQNSFVPCPGKTVIRHSLSPKFLANGHSWGIYPQSFAKNHILDSSCFQMELPRRGGISVTPLLVSPQCRGRFSCFSPAEGSTGGIIAQRWGSASITQGNRQQLHRDPQKFRLYRIHVVLSPRNLPVREGNLLVGCFFSPPLYSEIQPGIKVLCTWKHNTAL